MKYLAILVLLLFTLLTIPSVYGQPDSGKSGMMSKGAGMQCKGDMHHGDSCGMCKGMGHGGMMMDHDCGMQHDGAMACGRDGMGGPGFGGQGMMMNRCPMMQGGGMCRMVFRWVFGGMLLIALLLLILMEIQWVRLLSIRVKAAKPLLDAPKS